MQYHEISRVKRYFNRTKFELPKYGLDFEYDMTSKKGCIILPIFTAFKDIIPHYHVNCAFHMAHSLLCHSNIVGQKIPIFFYIEQKAWNGVEYQCKKSRIPEDRFMVYKRPDVEPLGNGQWISQALYMVLDERFKEYENCIYFDVDMFLAEKPAETAEKFDIARLWERKDRGVYGICSRKGTKSTPIINELNRTPRWEYFYELPENEGKAKWIQSAKDVLGLDTESVHSLGAGINSFCPNTISADFKDFIKMACHHFGSEEDTLSLYMQWSGKTFENLLETWDIVVNYTDIDMIETAKTRSHQFIHLHPDKKYLTNHENEALWREYIGIGKVI